MLELVRVTRNRDAGRYGAYVLTMSNVRPMYAGATGVDTLTTLIEDYLKARY